MSEDLKKPDEPKKPEAPPPVAPKPPVAKPVAPPPGPMAPEDEDDGLAADQVNIVTTGPGTFGPEGLAAVGSKRAISVAAFSATWMRPAALVDRNKLVKAAKIAKK